MIRGYFIQPWTQGASHPHQKPKCQYGRQVSRSQPFSRSQKTRSFGNSLFTHVRVGYSVEVHGAAITAGSMRIPNAAKRLNWRSAIGSRSLIGPRIRPEAAGGPPHQAPWTVHSPSSTLGGPFEIPMPIAVKGGVQDIEDKQLQLKRERYEQAGLAVIYPSSGNQKPGSSHAYHRRSGSCL